MPDELASRLRGSGYRLTPQRQLVLAAVEALGHATPDEVRDHLEGAVNTSTVYRNLEVLEELLKRLPSFDFRGVEVVLDAGGAASAVFFHHDELPAGLEVREVAKLVPAAAQSGRLASELDDDTPAASD